MVPANHIAPVSNPGLSQNIICQDSWKYCKHLNSSFTSTFTVNLQILLPIKQTLETALQQLEIILTSPLNPHQIYSDLQQTPIYSP